MNTQTIERPSAFTARKRDTRLFLDTLLDGLRVARRTPLTPAADILVLPPDPWDVFGSLGDEAMLTASTALFRAANPTARLTFLCHGDLARTQLREAGHRALELPSIHGFSRSFRALLETHRFDAFIAVGADVLDGHYSADLPRQMLIAASVAARSGIETTVTGFSFNDAPAPILRKYFAQLPRKVRLNVRDSVSLARMRRFAPTFARLSADVAFLLEPQPVAADTATWIEERRLVGRKVAGFNLRPLMDREPGAPPSATILREAASAMTEASKRHGVDWLLIPHDYRGAEVGDFAALEPLAELLAARGETCFRLLPGRHSAAALKGLVARLDAVVTARMHLGVAALGSKTPVCCFGYQGKFDGLLRHFDIPTHFVAGSDVFARPGECAALLDRFLDELSGLRSQIGRRLPDVLAMSRGNFPE